MSDHPHSDTREKILRVALRLFADRGYPDTSMEEIAKQVGISKPAIYHHFSGKEELFRTLLDDARRQHEEMIAELRSRRLNLFDLVEEAIRAGINLVRQNNDWVRLMIRFTAYPQEISEIADFKELECAVHDAELGLLEEAMGDRRLRPGLTMRDFVFFYHGAVFTFMARALLTGEEIDEREAPARLRDLILFGGFGGHA